MHIGIFKRADPKLLYIHALIPDGVIRKAREGNWGEGMLLKGRAGSVRLHSHGDAVDANDDDQVRV